MRHIEDTPISIKLAIGVIGAVAWWLCTLSFTVAANGKDIEAIKASREIEQKQFSILINRMDRRIFEIQIKLGMKPTEDR